MTSLSTIRWTDANPNIQLSFAYEKRRVGADMQYQAQITVNPVTSPSYFGYPINLQLSIDSTLVVTTTLKAATPRQWSSAIVYTSPWYTVPNKTSGTVPVSFKVYSGLGSSRTATYSYNMDVDPAASEISASNGTLGTPLTLSLTRYNTSFTDTITYQCGPARGTVKSGSTAASVIWDTTNGNVVALAAHNTSGPTVNVTFTVTSYSEGTKVGENTTTVTMDIPSSVIPSLMLNITDAAGYKDIYGAYVQGYSNLRIAASATLAYGSPIKAFTVTFEGKDYNHYSIETVITSEIQGKGILPVTAAVADGRSRSSGPVSTDITVLEYSKPFVSVKAYRCNSSGAADQEGAYMRIEVTSTISSLNGRNSATYKIVHSGGTLTGSGTSFTSDPLDCDVTSMHNIEVTVTDKLSSTTKAATIPIAYTLMDYYYTGRGIAFGKVGTRDGFDCAMPAYFTGGVTIGTKTLIDLIYPVGSIYMSTNNTSPQSFFGGTWERIQDRFLLAAGSTYAAGGTGGSATHTLTIDEIPYHGHVVGTEGGSVSKTTAYIAGATGGAGARGESSTDNAGGGEAHNNMPPYLTVYMWKRTK